MTVPEMGLLVTFVTGIAGVLVSVASAGRKVGSILEDLGHLRSSVATLQGKVDQVHDELVSLRSEHDTLVSVGRCPAAERRL